VFNNLGDVAFKQAAFARAHEYLQQGQELARQIQHAEFLSLALCFLGKAMGFMQAYDQAVGYFQESLALAQQLSTPLRLIMLFTDWGEMESFHGQVASARRNFLEVLVLDAEEQRYPELLARAHEGLAHIALQEQDIGKAPEHAAESARLFKQLGHFKAQEVLPAPPDEHQAVQEGMAH
jgi:tetratricopeptide (TPR) repeat protein